MAENNQDGNTLTAEQVARLLAAAQTRPELPAFDWEEEHRVPAPAPAAPRAIPVSDDDPGSYDPVRRKIRDRYIGVRFAGVARSGADLQDGARVIKAARLAFEEEKPDSAIELLELAAEQHPREPKLWLAHLEILYLLRAGSRFTALAREFHARFPDAEAWPEVARLGAALAPDDPLFGGGAARREHDRYGPWPDLPNWIEAPWDLTSEVLAGDFHRAMTAQRLILIA